MPGLKVVFHQRRIPLLNDTYLKTVSVCNHKNPFSDARHMQGVSELMSKFEVHKHKARPGTGLSSLTVSAFTRSSQNAMNYHYYSVHMASCFNSKTQTSTKRFMYIHWRRKRGGGGGEGARGHVPPHFFDWGAMVCLCPPPPPHTHTHTLLTPHFYFPLELYVYITLTNNYLAFFIYQLISLWTVSINWHRWLLLNNHISNTTRLYWFFT